MPTRNGGLLALAAAAALGCSACGTDVTAAGETDPDVLAGIGSNGVCRGEDGEPLPTAPRSARVDLEKPSFSNPLDVSNPLFPIAALTRVILLGTSDGLPLRVETTLLQRTRTIETRPRPVETLVSQYLALLDGRIHEVALDFYAQADDGAVWYAGEDVFNYEDGVIADTEGTWLAGEDGPIAMIMPADPKVGDVWRPENICGLVFEEVTAKATGLTVPGPRGPVSGVLRVEELHQDGLREDKLFAPGYGEFSTGAGANLEAVALAVPIDALGGPVPAPLVTIADQAEALFGAAGAGDWTAAGTAAASITAAWASFQTGSLPPMLRDQMVAALSAMSGAVSAQNPRAAQQAAILVARAGLDFQLRHRPVAAVDADHLALWTLQLQLDLASGGQGAVAGDLATMQWIADRYEEDGAAASRLASILAELRHAVGSGSRTAVLRSLTALRTAARR